MNNDFFLSLVVLLKIICVLFKNIDFLLSFPSNKNVSTWSLEMYISSKEHRIQFLTAPEIFLLVI